MELLCPPSLKVCSNSKREMRNVTKERLNISATHQILCYLALSNGVPTITHPQPASSIQIIFLFIPIGLPTHPKMSHPHSSPLQKKNGPSSSITHLTKTLYTISYMTIWSCCHIRSQTFTKPTANTPDRMMTYGFTHPPIHITIWLNGHRSSCYKLEMLYLPYNKVYGNQN